MSKLVVLGVGNILMSDEGLGVRLLEAVRDARDWPGAIEFIDGGVGGLNLLNVIEQAQRLVVFDAAQMDAAPGEYRIISPQQVADEPAEHRVSMHDVPLGEILQLCERFAHRPADIRIMVIQPETIEFGRQLSAEITKRFDELVDVAVQLVCDSYTNR